MNKRGISPLIATVIIIGFTIVIAAIIFRWSGNLFEKTTEGEGEEINKLLQCFIDLDYGNFCIDSGYIRFKIENNENKDISNFIFKIHYNTGILTENSEIGLGSYSAANFYFPYDSDLIYNLVEVYPQIQFKEESVYCQPKKIAIDNLQLNNCGGVASYCGDHIVNQDIEECDYPDLDEKFCDDFDGLTGEGLSCYPQGQIQQCKFNFEVCTQTTPPNINFNILDSSTYDDFWYPLKIRIQNNGDDIHAFKIQIEGDINDEYIHRHTIFFEDTKDINVFYSPEVGDISSITVIPGKKIIPVEETVEFEWYESSSKSINGAQIINNINNWGNVLGYWVFKQETESDTVVYDKSPNTVNCDVDPSDSPVWKKDKYCLFGRCYYIDGLNNGLSCEDPLHFDNEVTNEITVEAVVRPWRVKNEDGENVERTIASKYFNNDIGLRSWVFRLDVDPPVGGNENLLFRIYKQNGNGREVKSVDSNKVLTIGSVWHHLVGQYDGENLRLYVDGELFGYKFLPGVEPIIDSPTANVMLGDWINLGGDTFNGRIESVAIYNTFLDEITIKKHANDLFSLTDCPSNKNTNEPDYCEHIGSFGIDNSVDINDASGWGRIIGDNYVGLREYIEFSDSSDHSNCDVAIMAVHGGSIEKGTEQMARYVYNELVNDGKNVALWVYGSRNTACSMCSENCEDVCHHVTSASIDPNCDPYLREILSNCKIGITLHGCSSDPEGGCPANSNTENKLPVLIGGRAEYRLKELVKDELDATTLSNDYYFINFDDVQDCKFYLATSEGEVSCYRGVDYCNIVNQFPRFNLAEGLPGLQIEMPTEMRENAEVTYTDEQCDAPNPPEGCLTRFENKLISGDTLITSEAFIQAINDYIVEKEW